MNKSCSNCYTGRKENKMKKEIYMEIREALKELGFNKKESDRVEIKSIDENRHEVHINGDYFGVWDSDRKTFVD